MMRFQALLHNGLGATHEQHIDAASEDQAYDLACEIRLGLDHSWDLDDTGKEWELDDLALAVT